MSEESIPSNINTIVTLIAIVVGLAGFFKKKRGLVKRIVIAVIVPLFLYGSWFIITKIFSGINRFHPSIDAVSLLLLAYITIALIFSLYHLSKQMGIAAQIKCKECEWDCSDREIYKFRRSCFPQINNDQLIPLFPARHYMYVDETDYSSEFAASVVSLKKRRNWKKSIEKGIKDGSGGFEKAPRVFLSCAYLPIQVLRETLRHIKNPPEDSAILEKLKGEHKEGEPNLLQIFSEYTSFEQLFDEGEWRKNANSAEAEHIIKAAKILFPHFSEISECYDELGKATLALCKKYPTYKGFITAYKEEAIVRILIQKRGRTVYPSTSASEEEKRVYAVANELFFTLNGDVPCYLVDPDYLNSNNDDINLLPQTDFAIIRNLHKDRAIEIWDFYGESHLLLTHGRPENCLGDVAKLTSYERLENDWRCRCVGQDPPATSYTPFTKDNKVSEQG